MDTIAIIDFGGQYTHLIANRIRRLGVYSEIIGCREKAEKIAEYKGVILSGGPNSVLDAGSPSVDPKIFSLGLPVLGLCYGHQLMAKILGGSVVRGDVREYGMAEMTVSGDALVFEGLGPVQQIWMSHGDTVERLPEGFEILASTLDCRTAAVGNRVKNLYGLQFHPEVTDTPNGMKILDNFINICGCRRDWSPDAFLKGITGEIRRTCGNRKVFLLVSGGVDSSVAFALLNSALGPERVMGLHIDNGLMRYNESSDIMVYMREHGFDNIGVVDASDRFLSALRGVADPEEKRNIIGKVFLDVQAQAQADLGLNTEEWLLGQGTIYPDTIESAGTEHADKIKTHHNRVDVVLELIDKGLVIEPLAQLYKDEVRMLGEKLGLPKKLVWRHPFPGPGLGVRLFCSDGKEEQIEPGLPERLKSVAGSEGYGSTVLSVRSVGVQGDGRTYAHPALLTGERNWETLERVSTRITNTISGVNRVVYGLNIDEQAEYRLIEAYPTKERLDKLRLVDSLVTEALYEFGEYGSIWQMPVVLLPLVNRKGEECIVLRPITSQEAMTARFAVLKDPVIQRIVDGVKRIKGVADVFYDVTNKPPATIEWE